MPHTDEALSLQVAHTKRTDNPHLATASQLGLGVLQAASGTVMTMSGTPVNLLTGVTGSNVTYLVMVGLSSAVPTDFSAVSIVSCDIDMLRATALQTANRMVISVSGTNIRAQQNSGAPSFIQYTLIRLS
jgi:hypothetical protein